MSKQIWIDKTYVRFEGTRYRNTFLREEGWNDLQEYIWSKKRSNVTRHLVLRRAFEQMIAVYMDHVATLLGYDPSRIEFSVDPESDIKLQLVKDTAKEWLTYPGPWQDWPENN